VKKATLWYRRGLLFLVIGAVTFFVWKNVSQIDYSKLSVSWSYMILATCAALAFYLLSFAIWRKLSRRFGIQASFVRESQVFFVSQLGKYVPGKLTLLLLRLDGYRNHSKRNVAIATGVEMIASLSSWCFIVSCLLIFLPLDAPNYIRYTGIAGFIMLISSLHPKFLKRSVNWVLHLFGKDSIDQSPSYGMMLRFVTVYMVGGFLQGLVLFFVLNALSPVSFYYYPSITAAYLSAVLIGIAAVFAPGGIGVREGMLFLALPMIAMIAPKPIIVASVVVTRLLFTLVEVFLGISSSIIEKVSSGKQGKRQTRT